MLTETGDRLGRARLLPAAVEILLATGDLGGAREAAGELAGIAGDYRTRPCGRRRPALGAVCLAEGDAAAPP